MGLPQMRQAFADELCRERGDEQRFVIFFLSEVLSEVLIFCSIV